MAGRDGDRTGAAMLRRAGTVAALGLPYWGVSVAAAPGAGALLGRWVLYRGSPDQGRLALTFDDGPDPEYTPAFLDALGDRRATFFVLGERARRWPELTRRLVHEGFEVACHGDSHRHLAAMGPRRTEVDLRRAHASIAEVTGRAPRFYRPPYGVFNLAAWTAAPRLGMQRTLWSAWAKDWRRRATPQLIAARSLAGAQPGAILLLHDSDGTPGAPARTLEALPTILDGIRRRGIELVTLSDLTSGEPGAIHSGPSSPPMSTD
jgi:peptidoglycan-N-acetylglucosamine deacetylase